MNKTEEKHELSCVEAPKSLSGRYTFQMAMFAFIYCRRIEGHWFEGWLQNLPFQVPTENKYRNEMMQMRQAVQFSQILQSGIIKMCVCVSVQKPENNLALLSGMLCTSSDSTSHQLALTITPCWSASKPQRFSCLIFPYTKSTNAHCIFAWALGLKSGPHAYMYVISMNIY